MMGRQPPPVSCGPTICLQEFSYIETANGCAEAGGVVSCALGDLAATEMATGVIQVTVLSDSAGTVLTNTASVTSTSPDGDVSNNTATITTTIQDGISAPSLSAWGTVRCSAR